jgi:hypothetical protein
MVFYILSFKSVKECCYRNVHAFGMWYFVVFWVFLMSWIVAEYTLVLPRRHHWLYFLDTNSWDEGIVGLQNVCKYSPSDTASYLSRLEFSCVQQSDMMHCCYVSSTWHVFCLMGHENTKVKCLCTVNVQNANTDKTYHVKAVAPVTSDSGAHWTYRMSCHALTPLM